MMSGQAGYVVVLCIATGLAILVAWLAWQRRQTPGGAYFALLMLAIAAWAFAGAFEAGLSSAPAKVLWAKLCYPGIVSISPLWLLFALDYSRQTRPLSRTQTLLLWGVPAVVLLMAFTNDWHSLVWTRITPATNTSGEWLIYERGPVVWINVVYSYLLLLSGTVILVRAVLRSVQLYRQQVGALLLGAALPWISNIAYVFNLSPWPEYDLTPIAFALSGMTIAYGLFRFQMLDVVPVARGVLIENMVDGVLVLDARNRIIDVNPATCLLLACDEARIVGKPAEAVLAEWPELIRQGHDAPQIQTEIVLNGSQWFDVRISLLRDRRQQFTGWLVVLRDIHARKQAETMLQQYNQELQARNTELDAFAHTVAHDLKTPLSTAVGYGTLLEARYAGLSDVKRLEILGIINRSGRRMASIIDELLLLAQIRKLSDVQFMPLDTGAIVAEAQERLILLIEERQAEIVMPAEWPVAFGYAAWVQEIWANYIGNALKYGGDPAAGIAPRVQLGWDGPTGEPPFIRFWVQDNGPGLAPEEQARLFTPFTRLDQAHAKGHGLGLSIVRRIIDKLGGQVDVESELGRGSCFWFTLPAMRDNNKS